MLGVTVLHETKLSIRVQDLCWWQHCILQYLYIWMSLKILERTFQMWSRPTKLLDWIARHNERHHFSLFFLFAPLINWQHAELVLRERDIPLDWSMWPSSNAVVSLSLCICSSIKYLTMCICVFLNWPPSTTTFPVNVMTFIVVLQKSPYWNTWVSNFFLFNVLLI